MAKVYLDAAERMKARLAVWVYAEMRDRGLSQRKVAQQMGISQQALHMKLKLHRFSYDDFVCFVKIFDPTVDEILYLVWG